MQMYEKMYDLSRTFNYYLATPLKILLILQRDDFLCERLFIIDLEIVPSANLSPFVLDGFQLLQNKLVLYLRKNSLTETGGHD